MRQVAGFAVTLTFVVAYLLTMAPARSNAESGPLDTPTSMVRFYFHALDTHQCDLAFKFASGTGQSLGAFRRDCRAIRHMHLSHLPAGLSLVSLAFVDPEVGWATARTQADAEVSACGTILLHTLDGGLHSGKVRLP